MSLDDPQYYDKMIDPVVYARLGWYTAFHREEARLRPPSREDFYAAISAVPKGKHRSQTAKLECYCMRCDTSASTTLNHLRQGQGVACKCRHKTEAKLFKWMNTQFRDAIITTQYRGPKTTCGGQTHFDYHIVLLDGFEVIVELDGAQHFWIRNSFYTDGGRDRDVVKEDWAIARGLCVVRVLQEDVWNDRFGWQEWLIQSIEAARMGEPRAITPNAPEYRGSDSAYVQVRGNHNNKCDTMY